MIPREPSTTMTFQSRRPFSSFAPRCGRTILLFYQNLASLKNSQLLYIELADALLENTNVTYLELQILTYTKDSAEAIAKYVRASKYLRRIRWDGANQRSPQREEMFCSFLLAIQESTSHKELHMEFPPIGGPLNLAFEKMMTHTQSLRSLSLSYPAGLLEDIGAAAAQPGLKNNTTLR
jgi:hypothetical protein